MARLNLGELLAGNSSSAYAFAHEVMNSARPRAQEPRQSLETTVARLNLGELLAGNSRSVYAFVHEVMNSVRPRAQEPRQSLETTDMLEVSLSPTSAVVMNAVEVEMFAYAEVTSGRESYRSLPVFLPSGEVTLTFDELFLRKRVECGSRLQFFSLDDLPLSKNLPIP